MVGCVEVDDDGDAARLRGAADRRDKFGKAVVDQHGVGVFHKSRRIGRQRAGELAAAPGGNGFFAERIEQDQRHRGGAAGNAHHAAAIDALGVRSAKMRSLIASPTSAERAGKLHARAEPRDGDRGIGGAAAAGDDELGRMRLWRPALEMSSRA